MVSMVTPGQPGAWEVLRGSLSCSFCPPPFWGSSPFGAPLWEPGLLTPPNTGAPFSLAPPCAAPSFQASLCSPVWPPAGLALRSVERSPFSGARAACHVQSHSGSVCAWVLGGRPSPHSAEPLAVPSAAPPVLVSTYLPAWARGQGGHEATSDPWPPRPAWALAHPLAQTPSPALPSPRSLGPVRSTSETAPQSAHLRSSRLPSWGTSVQDRPPRASWHRGASLTSLPTLLRSAAISRRLWLQAAASP